ncbi:hypothetical protein SK128_012737 [Halocaridina rubra]|uniref:Uncharacterized protein n=1 Tax=Halocaridina rubra TaxID=373956 RepID=A0AAN8WND2_HALRR
MIIIAGPAALAPALIGSTLINGPVAFRCKQRNSSDRNLSSEESPAPYFDNRCVETDSASLWEPTINSSFPSSENISMKSVLCPEYEFDRSVFTSTIASEWGLVCDEAWMSPLYQIVISAGCMLGDIVGGTIGDK